jgi:hypothetical protein
MFWSKGYLSIMHRNQRKNNLSAGLNALELGTFGMCNYSGLRRPLYRAILGVFPVLPKRGPEIILQDTSGP